MKLRAWTVTDEDEAWTVVMHHHGLAARRIGANLLDYEFDDVICYRSPQFDHCGPRGPSDRDLFFGGWWFECETCGRHARDDSGGVERRGRFYCEDHADPYSWFGLQVNPGLNGTPFYGDVYRWVDPVFAGEPLTSKTKAGPEPA